MDEQRVAGAPREGPPEVRDALEATFHVREVRTDGDRLLYFGHALVPRDHLVGEVWPAFRAAGYDVRLTTADRVEVAGGTDLATSWGNPLDPAAPRQEHVIVAEPIDVGVDGVPWKNVVLAALTVLSTLYAGTIWYHIDVGAHPLRILAAWPFTVAVMGVWGVHEFGHYVMSRRHRVDASLPYFIPAPTLIGTMGAIIRMRGRMPDREALFDIGVAGPLAGIGATVLVTTVGLFLDPISVPQSLSNNPDAVQVHIGFPPLMYALAWLTGQPLTYPAGKAVNPVVIGGWVGMFVTFLNMLPVGQLDGGHVLRAMLGPRHETLAAFVPLALFGLAGYLHYFRDVPGNAVFVWVFWGLFSGVLALVGSADPIDEEPLDARRKAVGVLTLVLGALCFAPVPIAIVP